MATSWWCVNFDARPVLLHGLESNMWLMQYQYSHAGYHFQGHRAQLSATTANWNMLTRVAVGDWFAAYLPNSTFYAVGEVDEPRVREHQLGAARHVDIVERTTTEHRHVFFDGIIRYRDAPVLYEDFTDPWGCAITSENQPSEWRYPQRVDVRQWQHVVPNGISVDGLSTVVQFPGFRRAAFQIPETFFKRIVEALHK